MAYTPSSLTLGTWASPITIVGTDAVSNLDEAVNSIITTDPASLVTYVNTEIAKIAPYLSTNLSAMYVEVDSRVVAAEAAKIAAEASAAAALASQTSATASASSATTSATSATGSASSASTSATSATASASTATTAATSATASATSATASATSATGSATAAGTSATNAAASESAAGTSATSASASATSATASATSATASETNAGSSATSAASSATAAASSATSALASKNAAATSETNAATSASNANTSAGSASTSATSAGQSATAASTSASNAATSETNAAASAALAATFEPALYVPKADVIGAIGNINSPLLDLPLNNSLAMKQGVGSVTFARSTTGTYIDRYGVLQYASIDEPRFEKDGLLIEGASTNLLTYSEVFQDASWGKSNCVATDNVTVSPDGSTNASSLISSVTTGVYTTTQKVLTPSASSNYSMSCFVKPNGYNVAYLQFRNFTTAGWQTVWFDLVNGTAHNASSEISNVTIEAVSNGFYRISASCPTNQSVASSVLFGMSDNTSTALIDGDGVSGLYLFGAQLEELPFATSYIPTTTTAVTRNVDSSTSQAINNISDINKDFTIIFDFKFLNNLGINNESLLSVSTLNIYKQAIGSFVVSFNGTVYYYTTGMNLTEKTRVCIRRGNNILDIYIDGLLVDTNTLGSTTAVNGSVVYTGGSLAYTHLLNFKSYDFALSPTEIALA